MIPPKFTIDITEWKTVNIESAKYILHESNTYLKYQVDSTDKITNRAFSILTLLIPITSVIVAFFINEKYKPVYCDRSLNILLLIVLVALISIMFFLGKLVFPRLFMPLGREPRVIAIQDFLINADSYLALVLAEIETAQERMDYNEIEIAARVKTLKNSMISLWAIFIFAVLAAMLFFTSFQ